MLQHAWADIEHSLRYKIGFGLPAEFARRLDRLAAMLESADREFDQLRPELEEFAVGYHRFQSRDELEAEQQRLNSLTSVMDNCPTPAGVDPTLRHRLAEAAMALGNWQQAIDALAPLARDKKAGAPMLRDLGVSLTQLHRQQPESEPFQEGQGYLQDATRLTPNDADAWASLGGTWRRRELAATEADRRQQFRTRALECYRQAWQIRPGHSYGLGNYLEYLAADHPDLDIPSFFQPSLASARSYCQRQIELSVNMPWAAYDLGKFALLLGDPLEAFQWYVRGIARSTSDDKVASAAGSFRNLEALRGRVHGFDWLCQLLALAQRQFSPTDGSPVRPPVFIVTGSRQRAVTAEERLLLEKGFGELGGTVIGGTSRAVSGLVAELGRANPRLRTLEYLPVRVPGQVGHCERRLALRASPIQTEGEGFSPLEPLHYWTDILSVKVAPKDVRLLCLGGDELPQLECELALALGARVGLLSVGEPGREMALAREAFWKPERDLGRLLSLSAEPARVRSFLNE